MNEQTIEFEVKGIEVISYTEGENQFSAQVWGSNPHEKAYVRCTHDDWRLQGQLYGHMIKAQYHESIGYVVCG